MKSWVPIGITNWLCIKHWWQRADNFKEQGTVLITVADRDKPEALAIARELVEQGYKLCATKGTADYLQKHGIVVQVVNKIGRQQPDIAELIRAGKIQLVINTMTKGKMPQRDGFRIRRAAVEHGIPCLTSLDPPGRWWRYCANLKRAPKRG